jgi:PAS domain S-box-containing protein
MISTSTPRLRDHPYAVQFFILLTAIFVFSANLYGLIAGVSIVVPHLFYIPIILAAFFYPRRGVAFAVLVSTAYFLMVVAVRPDKSPDIISAAARCFVFVIIAAVVSYLSEQVTVREHKLKQAKEEWERTFDSVPDLIALIDREHHILRVNRAMAASIGISSEQAIGKRCYEVMHNSSTPPLHCPHTLLLADGNEHTEEIHEDNLGGDFLVTTSPLHDADGNLIGSVHIARDVTERRKIERALLQKTEELDQYFSTSLDLFCIADTEGNFRRLNPQWEKTLGYTLAELEGKQFLDFVHPNDLPGTLAAIADLSAQKEVLNFTNRYRHRDGTHRWIEWRSFPKGDRIFAAARDITERRETEEALKAALKKLNMLSSITRHDILNQITGLRTFLELSREDLKGTRFEEFIEKEDQAAEAIQRQIEFTRYYQDIGVNAPDWQDMETAIREAYSQLRLETLDLQVAVGGTVVFADPLIVKVFFNLMENSLRHGGRVTRLSFSSRETKAGLVITYRDDGAGISAEDKEKLFRKGFGKHTGLGLFLSREILAITGIAIIENGEPGKGVQFEITVPEGRYRFIT